MILGPEQARILVVSASPYTRFVISGELSTSPDLFVVGTAEKAEEISYKEALLKPDLAVVDVKSPHDLASLGQIVQTDIPALAVCGSTQEGAEIALAALETGAADVVAWPNRQAEFASFTPGFTCKVRRLARLKLCPPSWHWPSRVISSKAENRRFSPGDSLVVVSASTGNLYLLIKVLAGLPADLPASLLVFLPLPADYLRRLLQRLDDVTHFNLCEASDGLELQKGKAYFAADGYQVRVESCGCLELDCASSRRKEIGTDETLFSLAATYGASVIYVLLGGAGPDGGTVLRQDLPPRVSQKMLVEAATPGSGTGVLPADRLVAELVDWVWDNQAQGSAS
jgi:two-component system chemotaxis response regulator CheB